MRVTKERAAEHRRAIGAVVAARAVAKADQALSDDILDAARRVLGEVGGEGRGAK